MKHEVHNPDILTPEQIGEGYRLLLKSELGKQEEPHQEIEVWRAHPKKWNKSKVGYFGDSCRVSYRVPLATWPLPEAGSQCDPGPEGSHGAPTDWIPWHGGKCPLKDEEVEEWAYMARDGFTCSSPSAPSCYTPYWEHNAGADDIITYRVLKWKEKPYAAPPVKSPEVHELQERFAEPQLTYHQWRGEPRDQESPLTDNDPWECLLRTNADLGREVSELKKQRDALSSQLQGVIVACHLRGYHVGDSLGEWIEKQLKDASADRAIEIAGDQALVNLLSETREAFYESLRREAQLRSALQIIHRDHLWGSQEHAQDICAKALTLSAPPVVPVEDVKLLVDAIDSLNNAARFTVLIGEGLTELDAAQGAVDSALSTFTAKHKI